MNNLEKILSECTACIAYQPIKDEPELETLPIKPSDRKVIIPNIKDADPFQWAEKCMAEFRGENVFILIPGRKFDLYGTRVGNGGGWYDRFLSKVPCKWLRIGVANISQISSERLKRKQLDEAMDWILFKEESGWFAHRAAES